MKSLEKQIEESLLSTLVITNKLGIKYCVDKLLKLFEQEREKLYNERSV